MRGGFAMCMPNRAAAILVGALAFVSVSAPPAHANDYVLARSSKNKLQVLASGGAKWCDKAIKLKMVLEPDSPISSNEQGQLSVMGQLKTPITNECRAAETAELTVVEASGKTAIFHGTAAQGWTFSKNVPAVTAEKGGQTAAAAAAPQAAQHTAPTPADAPVIPPEVNFNGALLLAVRSTPDLLENRAVLDYWAYYRFRNEYRKFHNQEFQLQQLIQRAKADLTDAVAKAAPNRLTIVFGQRRFESYDFKHNRFPISLELEEISLSKPWGTSYELAGPFVVQTDEAGLLPGIPMGAEAAQQFTRKRTDRYGSTDRTIHIAVAIELDSKGFEKAQRGYAAKGSVVDITIYGDEALRQPIYRLTSAEIGTWRAAREAERAAAAKAEAERQAEQRRQQLAMRRDANIQMMSGASLDTRLANFIADGDLNNRIGLSTLRQARASAVILGQPVRVRMLVQAKGSGRSDVATDWPGNLNLSVADGHPELSSGTWYLVEGQLDVPAGEGGIQSRLAVQKIYACTKAKCVEATDPTAIVDRKLASLSQAGVQQ